MKPVCDLLEPLIPGAKEEIFGDMIPGRKKPVKCHKIDSMFAKFTVKQEERSKSK